MSTHFGSVPIRLLDGKVIRLLFIRHCFELPRFVAIIAIAPHTDEGGIQIQVLVCEKRLQGSTASADLILGKVEYLCKSLR